MGIRENLAAVREKIFKAAARAGRNPQDIKLVAVTKTIELPEIIEAAKTGVTIFGENRVQEAKEKITEFRAQNTDLKIEWHLIGHLQKNKTKYAVGLFDLIQTIDSPGLAEEVNKQAEKAGKTQRALMQVKISEEATKHGVPEKDMMELAYRISGMNNLKLEGLMTMTPYFEDAEKARPYFERLREIRDEAEKRGFKLPELSMGMSHDFDIAVEEGATMVRVGTAIFGERG
ncbi:MAG: YggS family pyridoxal phosphate-dependent enzyme [Nitrospiraceae bacterium]|nr:MAG: YggS family pyridoxal phosphate-dependent enzyme [Nitrospiraceae bacterium]